MGREKFPSQINSRRRLFYIVLISTFAGFAASLVVALYRIVLSYAEDGAFWIYGEVLKKRPYLIPVWIVVLALLGWGVGLLVKFGKNAKNAKGAAQMKGIVLGRFNDSWPVAIIVKFFGSAAGVLAGLSLGREGPSIQLGANVADGIGRRFVKNGSEQKIVIAAGSSAGLSAALGAPITGIMFALEEVFRYLSPIEMLAVAASSITSGFCCNVLLQRLSPIIPTAAPLITFGGGAVISWKLYWILPILGALIGLIGVGFNYMMANFQRIFERIPPKFGLRPLPMFLLAPIVGLFFPYIMGGGHRMLEELRIDAAFWFLILLLALKFLYSAMSYGSGTPGGFFIPLLAMGAATAAVAAKLLVPLGVDEAVLPAFIAVGMAGMLTASMRIPLTAIVLLFELTRSPDMILPLAIVCAAAYITAELMGSQPLYDGMLSRLVPDKLSDKQELGGKKKGSSHAASRNVIFETHVARGSVSEGKRLAELGLPRGCLVIAVERDVETFVPSFDTELREGDTLTVLCNDDVEEATRELCANVFDIVSKNSERK